MRLVVPAGGAGRGRGAAWPAGPGEGAPGVPDPIPDASQEAAIAIMASSPATMVVGAPGTGKTTLALEVMARAAAGGLAPSEMLLLTSSRRSAAELRDRFARRVGATAGSVVVRTVASFAFSLLRLRAAIAGEPPPTLISGPEQDRLLAELLEGHRQGQGVPVPWPPSVPPAAWGLRSFRAELRDLVMRAAERGLDPVALDELGRRHDQPHWRAAARIYQEYLDVTVLSQSTPDAGARYDPASVVDEAARLMAGWDEVAAGRPRPAWRLVVVDDYHEASAAVARLLRGMLHDGARLVLLGDPDSSVQAFRGATPALVGRAMAPEPPPRDPADPQSGTDPGYNGELGARQAVLDTVWRQGPVLRGVAAAVAAEISTVGVVRHRLAASRGDVGSSADAASSPEEPRPGGAPAADGPVRVAVLTSAAQEAAHVARWLRERHLLHGVPWREMAVVVRSGALVGSLRRSLAAASVPATVVGSDVPLRDEPAVRPLLRAMAVALGEELTPDAAVELLLSPAGGLDVIALRRLRRALRGRERAQGGDRGSDVLLVEALDDPEQCLDLPVEVRRAPSKAARVLAAGRVAAAAPDATAQTVLWSVWSAAGLAEPWRATALAGGPAGERADHDLDVVLALFQAAERFVERLPQAPPEAFVEHVTSQDLPADTVAAQGSEREAVAVLTPAGAAGRQWEAVVVAGVQEGQWPDLRLRDSLLGSQTLVEVVSGRAVGTVGAGVGARRAVLDDELRAFAVAVSRARSALLVTAVSDQEDEPSAFVDLVRQAIGQEDEEGARVTSPVSPLDLRGIVAVLRSVLDGAEGTAEHQEAAAGLLARLADQGVRPADPSSWYGVHGPSTGEPLWADGDTVPVSPSRLETVVTCPLRWALETAGGRAVEDTRQTLGTLVHALAERLPDGDEAELLAELDRRWGELGLRPGWPAEALRSQAEAMVRRLARHLRENGPPVAVEAGVRLEVGRALLRGTIDRVEPVAEGRVRIADLKTGKNPVTRAEGEENLQLAAYQLAVEGDGVEGVPPGTTSAGAALVYLATGRDGATRRTQPALGDDADAVRRTIRDAADVMAGDRFTARVNPLCPRCPVRRSCPAHPQGQQVGEDGPLSRPAGGAVR